MELLIVLMNATIGGHPFHTGWKVELETMVREVFIVLREGPYQGLLLVEMNILLRHLKQAFSISRPCETSPRLSPPGWKGWQC